MYEVTTHNHTSRQTVKKKSQLTTCIKFEHQIQEVACLHIHNFHRLSCITNNTTKQLLAECFNLNRFSYINMLWCSMHIHKTGRNKNLSFSKHIFFSPNKCFISHNASKVQTA
ncbi:hypothetical protein Hanom_Chr08g00704401 [Helianthus anomalus]